MRSGEYDPWQQPIKDWLEDNWQKVGDQRHPTKSILTGAIGLREELFDRAAYVRLKKIMKRLGWSATIIEVSGIRFRGWRKSS